MHHVRERGHTRTIFCIMTTEKVRSEFLAFSKHYLHLLGKVDAITICLNFCYKIISQNQRYHRNNDQNLSATLLDLQSVMKFNLERVTREQGEILDGNKGTELQF